MTTILEIEPAHQDALRATGLVRFEDFLKADAGPATSEHKIRSTAPIDLTANGVVQRYFLKRNFRIPPRHAIVPLLKLRPGFSQPRQEWEMLGRLQKAGIPAMKRVAMGERRMLGIPVSAFLLVEAVPMEHTLEDWLVPGFPKPPGMTVDRRRALLKNLGELLGKLHGLGFRWPDLHPKHIFASLSGDDAGGTWQFCLIDVERMTQNASLQHPAPDEMRRLIRNMRPMQFDAADADSLFQGYAKNGKDSRSKKEMQRLLRAAGESLPRLPDDYEHPRNIPLTRQNRIYLDGRVAPWLKKAGIEKLADAFSQERGESLGKAGLSKHRERIRLSLSDGNGWNKTLYLKRYVHPPAREQLRRMCATGFFRAGAYHETHFIKKLSLIGAPTMRFLAYGQEMKGPWERRSFAITEGLDGISLEKLLLAVENDPKKIPSSFERHEIIRQLGLLVRLLHAGKLFHRDLYLCHIFLTRNADGGIVLRVIDLARMIEKPMRPHRWRIKDLAALQHSATAPLVTRTDRLRFLKTYHDADVSKETLRRDIAEISARAARMTRHDIHRAARLEASR